jgi:hypothetical protein
LFAKENIMTNLKNTLILSAGRIDRRAVQLFLLILSLSLLVIGAGAPSGGGDGVPGGGG